MALPFTDPSAPTDRALPSAVSPHPQRHALFLDVDGTLLDFAEHPDAVCVEHTLIDLLSRLHTRMNGAIALLSGRSIATLDQFFHPLRVSAAGLHGLELRFPDGTSTACDVDPVVMGRIRTRATAWVRRHPEVLLEDKGVSVALHYRRSPEHESDVLRAAHALIRGCKPDFRLQRGNHVVEIRPAGADKGAALRHFMTIAPFNERSPIMLGDDFTDEPAFAAAQELGGTGIIVGQRRPTAARQALAGPPQVRDWLAALNDGTA